MSKKEMKKARREKEKKKLTKTWRYQYQQLHSRKRVVNQHR